MKSDVALLDKVTHYIVKRKGKQMRPMFVFLSAKMLGEVNQSTFDAATLVELLHTATIVHDDVVDDASERRGFFSVNALWKNKIAVLVGDYMLSRILLISIEKNNTDLLGVISRAVREMSEGELLQIDKARKLDITEEVYFDVIKKKTASLISSCCEAGALSVGASENRDRMKMFGEYVGMAFQIKDDIFDYGSSTKIGKPTGNDIRENKMTLPIIYALNHVEEDKKRKLMDILKNHNDNSKKINEAIEIVINAGGIQYAEKIMLDFANKALALIQDLPETEAKKSIEALVDYTMKREK
ncbi:MAG: polyprenyl synthetase family protein [Flavobacteriales bacterium]|nr:polyprenyl synthetase family protein [Flavobacteriales bacterium]